MIARTLLEAWVQDVPVCLPGRRCVDQTPLTAPLTAPLIAATSALTPWSIAIATACFAVAGVAAVLIGAGVRQQWRMRVVPRWLGVLVAGLLLSGLGVSWVVSSRLAVVDLLYSDVFGQLAAPVPSSLIGSWPAVLHAGYALSALGVIALVAVVVTALLARCRAPATG